MSWEETELRAEASTMQLQYQLQNKITHLIET